MIFDMSDPNVFYIHSSSHELWTADGQHFYTTEYLDPPHIVRLVTLPDATIRSPFDPVPRTA